MQIQGDGSQTRDFLYVDDAVDAIVRSLDAASGSIIPVGSGVSTSVRDLASLVVELTHSDVEPTVVAPRAIDRPGVTFPTEDAAQAIGWQPWTSLRDGLAATIAAG